MEIRKKIIEEKEYTFSEAEVEYIKRAMDFAIWGWKEGLDEGDYEGSMVHTIMGNVRIVEDIYGDIRRMEEEYNED